MASKDPPAASEASAASESDKALPTVILVLGMAGSGKTTFVQRLTADLYQKARQEQASNQR